MSTSAPEAPERTDAPDDVDATVAGAVDTRNGEAGRGSVMNPTPGAKAADAVPTAGAGGRPKGLFARLWIWLDKVFSALSAHSNFWHRVMAWGFLPLAYRSGIKLKGRETPDDAFECVLPFSRFNKNWYQAMAGAALLANSEVAGGMSIFKQCGGDYTVVCKELHYKFRRPCLGPAVYRCEPREDLDALVATGEEFNVTVDITVLQAVVKEGEKQKKVGLCTAEFHVAPKSKFRERQAKLAERKKQG